MTGALIAASTCALFALTSSPPILSKLVKPRASLKYELKFDFDTHAEVDPLALGGGWFRCTVTRRKRIGTAIVGGTRCRPLGRLTEKWMVHTPPLDYVITSRGLWAVSKQPRTKADINKITSRPPMFPTPPVAFVKTMQATQSGRTKQCEVTVASEKRKILGAIRTVWCRSTDCPGPGFGRDGPRSSRSLCISPSLGIVSGSLDEYYGSASYRLVSR